MPITTIPRYLYSSPQTKCLKLSKYPFFRKSSKQHLKIFIYYIACIFNLYLYGKICKYQLHSIIPALDARNNKQVLAAPAAVPAAAAAAAAMVVICSPGCACV